MLLASEKSLIRAKRTFRYDKILLILLLIFAWILFGLNYSNADYKNYEDSYNATMQGYNDGYFEIGFYIIVKVFAMFRIPYCVFLGCVAAICLFIFTNAIKRLTSKPFIAFLFYFIYPFVFDIVQYRNFLAFAIVLYGVGYLLNDKLKTHKKLFYYLFFIFLASLFHLSSVIYVAFVLVLIKRKKVFFSTIVILMIGLMLAIMNSEILIEILKFFKLDRFARYDVDYNYSTFLQYLAVYVFFMALALLKFKGNYKSTKFKILVVALLFVPFIILNGTSARFIRNVFIIFYCFLLDYKNKKAFYGQWKQPIILLFTFVAVISVFYAQLGSGLYYETVLKPILEFNWLFGK